MSRNDLLRSFLYDYDSDNDSLYLYDSKSKSNSSIEINNLVIDYNSKNEISGIEIFDASNFFSFNSGMQINKKMLSEIIDSKIQILNRGGFLLLRFLIQLSGKKEISTTLSMPYLEKSVLEIS